jgi:ABC-type lipoprotein export system ATPase subunit
MISLRNVEKYFEHGPTKTFVLRRINLDVGEGEFISIMGPSGAGKSTLLHVLGMHDTAWTGDYYLMGNPVHKMNKKDRFELYKKYAADGRWIVKIVDGWIVDADDAAATG